MLITGVFESQFLVKHVDVGWVVLVGRLQCYVMNGVLYTGHVIPL